MEQKREYDEHFKIILLGDNAVGKSSLMHVYCGGTLHPIGEYMDTMGVDQRIKWINDFNKKIQLRIWDASGAPRLQKVVGSYFSNVDAALICFDLTRKDSLQHTREYVDSLRAKKNVPMILLGCKADLEQRREVSVEQAIKLADELGLDYIDVSAFKKLNVEQPFTQLVKQIYIRKQLDKIKAAVERYFVDYLKEMAPLDHKNFFTEQAVLPVDKEKALRKEYETYFRKLFYYKSVEELVAFYSGVLGIKNRADELHEQENPFKSIFASSPLSKMLKQTLDEITNVFAGVKGLSTAKEPISQKPTVTNVV